MTDRLWEIMEDEEAEALTIYRSNGVAADSEGPTLHSREEFEEFVSALRNAASRVFPLVLPEMPPHPFQDPVIVARSGHTVSPVGTIGPKALFDAGGVLTLPVDGSTFDPDEYPELAEALRPLGLEQGRLPDLRGRVITKPELPPGYERDIANNPRWPAG